MPPRSGLSPVRVSRRAKPAMPSQQPPTNSSHPTRDADAPRVTLGLIVSALTPHRLHDVAGHLNVPVPALASCHHHSGDVIAQRMLAQLNDTELRDLARSLGVPTDGNFIDLYRRLHRLC